MTTLRNNPDEKRKRNLIAKRMKEGFDGEFRHKIHETPRKGRQPRHKINPKDIELYIEEESIDD